MRIWMIVGFALALVWAATPSCAAELTPAQTKAVRQSVRAHIQAQGEEEGGAFAVRDEKLDKEWRLELIRLHDEVRPLSDKLYSVCADFKQVGGATKLDVDFLVNRSGSGFEVRQAVIHAVGGKPRAVQPSASAPVKRSETAAGVYVCSMGDYSGPKTPDGRCPKCGMELIKKK